MRRAIKTNIPNYIGGHFSLFFSNDFSFGVWSNLCAFGYSTQLLDSTEAIKFYLRFIFSGIFSKYGIFGILSLRKTVQWVKWDIFINAECERCFLATKMRLQSMEKLIILQDYSCVWREMHHPINFFFNYFLGIKKWTQYFEKCSSFHGKKGSSFNESLLSRDLCAFAIRPWWFKFAYLVTRTTTTL